MAACTGGLSLSRLAWSWVGGRLAPFYIHQIYIYLYSLKMIATKQIGKKKNKKKLDSEHNIENTVTTVTYTPT